MPAHIGYWVDREVAGRGIIPTAVALACDHCWFGLGLHRVEINIRPENVASCRVVEKLGFRVEGLRPRYLHIDGRLARPPRLRPERGGGSRRPHPSVGRPSAPFCALTGGGRHTAQFPGRRAERRTVMAVGTSLTVVRDAASAVACSMR